MLVPNFIDQGTNFNSSMRYLMPLSEVDVTRDLLDISLIKRNSEMEVVLEFYLSLLEWTENQIIVNVNFTDPTLVSQGIDEDQVVVALKYPFLFISKANGLAVEPNRVTFVKSIPTQLPKWMDEKSLKAQTASGSKAIVGILVIQLFLKASVNDMWVMFFTLQLHCYIIIYTTKIPANSMLFIEELTKIIEFKLLTLEGIYQIYDQSFNFEEWLMQ